MSAEILDDGDGAKEAVKLQEIELIPPKEEAEEPEEAKQQIDIAEVKENGNVQNLDNEKDQNQDGKYIPKQDTVYPDGAKTAQPDNRRKSTQLQNNETHTFSSRRLRDYNDDVSEEEKEEKKINQEEEKDRQEAKSRDDQFKDAKEQNLTTATMDQTRINTEGNVVQLKSNPRFKNYSEVFRNLLDQQTTLTSDPVVSMIINYDSTRVIAITKKDDSEYSILQFSLQTFEETFNEKIGLQANEGEKPKHYIKIKDVEQMLDHGQYNYAVAYNDDGHFYLRTFKKESQDEQNSDKTKRTPKEIKENELDINELLGIENSTMCNQSFPDPFITCCFISEFRVFINLFLNKQYKHVHFIYDFEKKSIIGNKIEIDMILKTTQKNFPYSCFYNEERNEIYSFYRQGQAMIIDVKCQLHNTEQLDNNKMYGSEPDGRCITEKVTKDSKNVIQVDVEEKNQTKVDKALKNGTYECSCSLDRMTEMDLGQMYVVYNNALLARSSSDILFFKIEKDKEGVRTWKQYYKIEVRGFIFYIRGNLRIQVTTDDKIFFYLIDRDTFMPNLENVMYNFMSCNQCMIGTKQRYAVTYKTNQGSFNIYRRKFYNDFKVPIVNKDFEGSLGLELKEMNAFLVSQIDRVIIYMKKEHQYKNDSGVSFEEKGEGIPIKLLSSDTREPTQVIAIQKSKEEDYLAILSGKILMKDEQKINQLFIFKIEKKDDEYEFKQIHRHVVRDLPSFQQTCMQYHFKKKSQESAEYDTIIFCNKQCIFEFKFDTGKDPQDNTLNLPTTIVMTLNFQENKINFNEKQPRLFQPNKNQDIFLISTLDNCFHIEFMDKQKPKVSEITYNKEIEKNKSSSSLRNQDDIKQIKSEDGVNPNDVNKISSVQCIIYDYDEKDSDGKDNDYFYILANKLDQKLGVFVIKVSAKDPTKQYALIKWKNKLDIGDTNMFILRSEKGNLKHYEKDMKELVISFKTIFMNTYNVICMDISITKNMSQSQLLIFRHESFQLWESECTGLLLQNQKDFIHLSQHGMQILSMGSEEQRQIVDDEGIHRMIHSLESCNYLKVDKNNYLVFECSDPQNKIVSIEQEFIKTGDAGDETQFQNLLNVKIHDITLRELLLFNSLHVCATLTEIIDIVTAQPEPLVFYKSFLELNGANMVSVLSFDSRSMQYLLKDDFSKHFSNKYPLFYRNKIQKGASKKKQFFYRSAIDNALRNNQIRAVQIIIEYVIKYQNDMMTSFLFKKNFITLLEKGIYVQHLLDSNIFNYEFDFDMWPSTHSNDKNEIRPYNENIFMLRHHYDKVFPEYEFWSNDKKKTEPKPKQNWFQNLFKQKNSSKVYKIKYSLNLLPSIGTYLDKDEDLYLKVKPYENLENKKVNILYKFSHCYELDVFKSNTLKDMIQFKWDQFSYSFHLIGFSIHLVYLLAIFWYADRIYINGTEESYTYWSDNKDLDKTKTKKQLQTALEQHNKIATKQHDMAQTIGIVLICLISYPLIYEIVQIQKSYQEMQTKIEKQKKYQSPENQGKITANWEYFHETGNFIDLTYIGGSFIMLLLHLFGNPYTLASKLIMAIVVSLAIRRTFNFLRIFNSLSPIVTMLNNVIWQLRIFLTFYFILILMFSLMLGVLGVGNIKLHGEFRNTWLDKKSCLRIRTGDTVEEKENKAKNCIQDDKNENMNNNAPGYEYHQVGLFIGNMLSTIRISMGDFAAISSANYLTWQENYLFWLIWLLCTIITCIIFLNFIVAEASASYQQVSVNLENYVQKQRSSMVGEAESIFSDNMKQRRKDGFPKFIVIRKIET